MELALTHPATLADPDAGLIQRMAAGDEEALRSLYASHSRRLFAYAIRLTGNPAIAEEVLQDSLLAAWRGARAFRGEARVTTWLLGIVRHQALNATRRKRRETDNLEQVEDATAETGAPDLHAEAIDRS